MTDVEKKYQYRVFQDGTYLGLLQNVTSKFGYNQAINTAGTSINITIGTTADIAPLTPDPILDELGVAITDESDNIIYAESASNVVGDSEPNILIANGNDIEVWEFSNYHPNGIQVFSGYISKWKARFGGSDDIEVTCLSQGQDLNNYLMPSGSVDVLDQSQTSTGDDFGFWGTRRYGQYFTVGAGISNISKIILRVKVNSAGSRTMTLRVWASDTVATIGGTPLGSSEIIVSNTSFAEQSFIFSTPITVSANTQYFFSLEIDSTSLFADVTTWGAFDSKDASGYAGGSIRSSNNGGAWTIPSDSDFYFKTYTNVEDINKTYTSQDPSTGILDDFMDDYISRGGLVSKPTGGYLATGDSVTYSFKLNTILEGIQKVQELGPSDWYWYVDPADNTLYYSQSSTTADHTIVKGKHIEELDIEATKENIVNIVYFSGGDDGSGDNVFVKLTDTTSIVENRVGLARLTDNRVSGSDGVSIAQVLAQNYIDRNNAETYLTQVTVVDGTYDISLYDLGDIVGFAGFGNFADNLLLQIVAINRHEEMITLSLGVLPKRTTAQVQQIERKLIDVQTLDNPTTPS